MNQIHTCCSSTQQPSSSPSYAASSREDSWHLIVIHLVMNVKVALLPTTFGAAIEDAPLDGADVPPNYRPVE